MKKTSENIGAQEAGKPNYGKLFEEATPVNRFGIEEFRRRVEKARKEKHKK